MTWMLAWWLLCQFLDLVMEGYFFSCFSLSAWSQYMIDQWVPMNASWYEIEMGRETQHEENDIEGKSWPNSRDDTHLLPCGLVPKSWSRFNETFSEWNRWLYFISFLEYFIKLSQGITTLYNISFHIQY